MRENPGVSVIIPIYNVAEYLDRCIQSVLQQTYSNLEIILIDDGSTDACTDMCMRYIKLDNRVVYARRQNRGLGEARNLGLRLSSFEYVTFLDADDWLDVDFVQLILGKMIAVGADIGICDIYYVDNSSVHMEKSQIRLPKHQITSVRQDRTVINKCRTFAWGKIYKRALFFDNKIWYPKHSFEDIPVTPVLTAMAQGVIRIDRPLIYYFRNRPNSLSNNSQGIHDMGLSLKLLHSNLANFFLLPSCSLEFKKILIGQLRFAFRKWGHMAASEIQGQLQHLIEIVNGYFPGMSEILFCNYYSVGGGELLNNAVDYILPFHEQIVSIIDDADIVVSLEPIPQNDKRLIYVPMSDAKRDGPFLAWEMAERIAEAL